jgi:hypothetical protein
LGGTDEVAAVMADSPREEKEKGGAEGVADGVVTI